jgi:large subunit ribosomal protein L13
MKTWTPTAKEVVEQKWWIVDAKDKTLGHLAVKIADTIRGKNKATYTPSVDTGDFVIVINCGQTKLTGKKWEEKKYYRHSRFFGALKEKLAKTVREEDPERLIREAVLGMLPQNKLRNDLITKVKIYPGAEHPHVAQRPMALS